MKIAPNELRIGNWVKWPDEKEPNEVPWDLGHWLGVHAKNYGYPEGIELTPEWLERFGFVKPDYRDTWGCLLSPPMDDAGSRMRIKDNTWLSYETTIHVRYVHQLQNLFFALTGRELEIKK